METIYLQDNIELMVKLERLEQADVHNVKAISERTKIGEIYQTAPSHLAFVCTHCSAEFSLFLQFTSHIDTHLQQMLSNTIKAEPLATELGNGLCDTDIKPTLSNAEELEIGDHATRNDCTETNVDYESSMDDIDACNEGNSNDNERPRLTDTNSSQRPKYKQKLRLFECFDCHRQFNGVFKCRKHMRNHLVTNCQHCSQPTRTLKAVRLHRRLCRPLSADDIATECFVCLRMFPSYRYYYMHAREEHGLTSGQINKRRKTFCKWCSLDLKTTAEYLKHKQWHKQRRSTEFSCEVCGKVFQSYNVGNYKCHMQQHSGEKYAMFTCEICNKEYSVTYKLEHMRLHAGETHQCPQCGILFSTKVRLGQHIQTHSTDRPFECGHCKRRFRTASFLKRHERMHTGEFIHYCEPCKKGYTSKLGLQLHSKKVHGLLPPLLPTLENVTQSSIDDHRRPFECEQCKKRFCTGRTLKKHLAKVHGSCSAIVSKATDKSDGLSKEIV